ncbi:MAG: PAS domain-containing protein [Alphaproteobacteria bacterium]|nr:PAS domain-containing protein [Alphaproteobacteria bacterium]
MEQHRNPGPPILRQYNDGKWYIIKETRTPDGGIAITFSDVTELQTAKEAREKLSKAVENVPVGIALFDSDDRLVFFNNRYGELMEVMADILKPGVTFEEMVRTLVDRQPVEDARGREEEFIRERMEHHRNPTGPYELCRPDRWLQADENRMPDGSTFVILRDITERKRIERAREEAEERFRSVFDNVPIWLSLRNLDGRYLLVNKPYADRLGKTVDEIVSKMPDEVHDSRVAEASIAQLREVVETGEVVQREIDYRDTHDNLEKSRFVVKFPIRDDAGEIVAVGSATSDITERKRAEEALKEIQARLANILDNSPAPIYFKDTKGRFLVANKQYQKMYDVTFEDIKGKTSKEIFGDDLGEMFFAHDQEVLNTRKVIEREENIFGRTYLTLKFPIVDPTGELLGLGGIETDITERKRTEEALRDSGQRFKDIVEAASDWFWEMDENLRFTFFSDRRQELYRCAPEHNIGMTRWEVAEADPDNDENWRQHRATLEAHKPFRDFEFVFTRKGGETAYNKISGRPVFDANGAFKGYRGAATEITEQKEAQAQLIQAAKLATLGEMASGIAHEINQPLSVVGMAAELSLMSMEEGEFDTDFVRRKLQTIVGQKERMAGIINHMRLFSRRDNAKLESFDPLQSVSGAVDLIAKQLEGSGIELEETLPATCRNVSGYPLQLEQVVLNLLKNAQDAVLGEGRSAGSGTNADAPKVRVSLVDYTRRERVVISVTDNGGGIPEKTLKRIFDPFFTTKKEGHGTGLGLSISYSIIDAMGGRLEAHNTKDGARFEITLPVSADGPDAADTPPRGKKRKAGTRKPRSDLPRVLVVDDEEVIAEELAEYLGRKGYDVATAGSGLEALELHRSRPADIVITDLLMPEMDGNELIRRLHRTDPDLPIMVVTGHTTFGEEKESVTEGASLVLKKPISLRELSDALSDMVRYQRCGIALPWAKTETLADGSRPKTPMVGPGS